MRLAIISAITVLAAAGASASVLTIDDCIDMALTSNNAIKASEYRTEQAGAMLKSLRANYFPDINATATGLYSNARGSYGIEGGNLPVFTVDGTGNPSPTGSFAYFPGIGLDYKVGPMFTAGVEITQPVYMGGRIKNSVKMASHKADMAAAALEMTRDEVIVSVTTAYADVVKAGRMLEVAKEYRSVVMELKANVESAVAHGLRHNNDKMKVNVRINEADLSILRARNALRLAKMNLCRITGQSMLTDFDVTDEFPKVELPAAIDNSDVIYDRPEWQALQANGRALKSQVDVVRSELLPQVALKAGYAYNYGFELNHTELFNRGAFAVLLNVTIPIYHFGGRSAKVTASREQWHQSQAEMRDKEELLTLELHRAYSNLEEAAAALRLSETSVEEAAENMRLSRVMFDNGMETLSDYLEAQLLWNKTCQQRVEAGFSLYTAHISYLRASGKL